MGAGVPDGVCEGEPEPVAGGELVPDTVGGGELVPDTVGGRELVLVTVGGGELVSETVAGDVAVGVSDGVDDTGEGEKEGWRCECRPGVIAQRLTWPSPYAPVAGGVCVGLIVTLAVAEAAET